MSPRPPDQSRIEELWNDIWSMLEDGQSDRAATSALRALSDEGDDVPEFHYLLGLALLDSDEPAAATSSLERAVDLAPDWPEATSAFAWAMFRNCEFDPAREMAERAVELEPSMAEVHQLLGLLAERAGQENRALLSFAEARRLDPERFPDPYHMDEEEFLTIAQGVVEELTPDVRERLENTAFFVQPFPQTELLTDEDPPLDPQLLGLFVGRAIPHQSVADSGNMPNTLYLFQNNLERAVGSREELEEEIRITVLHEIGHHLGWDEDELAERGLA